jgi:ADP-heptose:LPS heptosyltransferase
MGSGMAHGAARRGKRIAFGDRRRIIWNSHSALVFRGNPNVAPPGSERDPDIEWIEYYKGHRIYNAAAASGRWIWNRTFRPIPGEVFLDADELAFGSRHGDDFVVIEPELPPKPQAVNKRWPRDRFVEVARRLLRDGRAVIQLSPRPVPALVQGARVVVTPTIRHALAVLGRAALYVGHEGGMHHGAAAVGIPAVVLFGGFVPPDVTGYDTHTNLTGGAEACGRLSPCSHCRRAMESISVEEVHDAAKTRLGA